MNTTDIDSCSETDIEGIKLLPDSNWKIIITSSYFCYKLNCYNVQATNRKPLIDVIKYFIVVLMVIQILLQSIKEKSSQVTSAFIVSIPVSYTHLDVYKRQKQYNIIIFMENRNLKISDLLSIKPVIANNWRF